MEFCPDKLNRERGKALALQNQLKHLHRHLCVQDGLLLKKATAGSYIYPLSNDGKKIAFPKANIFPWRHYIYIAESPLGLTAVGQMQSCFLGTVLPSFSLCLKISAFPRKKCYCCSSCTGEHLTLGTWSALWRLFPVLVLALALVSDLPERKSLLWTQSHHCCS